MWLPWTLARIRQGSEAMVSLASSRSVLGYTEETLEDLGSGPESVTCLIVRKVSVRCRAHVRGDHCSLEQFFVPVPTTSGWCGVLKTSSAAWLPCWAKGLLPRPGPLSFSPQILAAALTECHRKSSAQGKPLALKVFVAGRNRLENDGATALAEAFGVSGFCLSCPAWRQSWVCLPALGLSLETLGEPLLLTEPAGWLTLQHV